MIGHDDHKLAGILGALRITRDTRRAGDGYLELRLYGHRAAHRQNRRRKRGHDPAELIPPVVAIHTGPAGMPIATSDPDRLRRIARLIDIYADGLDNLLNPPPPGDGEQLDLLTQELTPCPTSETT